MSDTQIDSITTGELSRAVSLIRGDIKDVKKDISERPTIQDYKDIKEEITSKASKDSLTAATDRIKELVDWQKWAMRVGVPALLAVIYNLANSIDGKIG